MSESDPSSARGGFLIVGICLAALALAAWMELSSWRTRDLFATPGEAQAAPRVDTLRDRTPRGAGDARPPPPTQRAE